MSAMGKMAFAYDPLCLEHQPGVGHPECPERLAAARAGVVEVTTAAERLDLLPRQATEGELRLVHDPRYVERARREIADGYPTLTTGDTDVSPGSWLAALAATGGVLAAVDAVMTGQARNAFCAVRPPGHHATPKRGMGFCVFNNVAVAARYAQKRHGVGRVLIVDWDCHHGNGTQETFYADPSVFYFSTHLWPFYPGTGHQTETGTGDGAGTTMNCPFALGSGGPEVLDAFRRRLVPAMHRFKPELVLVSAGFDSLARDPVGRMALTPADFSELTAIVMEIAAAAAGARVVSALEGGYDLVGLRASVGAHVAMLISPDVGSPKA